MLQSAALPSANLTFNSIQHIVDTRWWSFHDELVYNDRLWLGKVEKRIQNWNQIRGHQTDQIEIGHHVFHKSGAELQSRRPTHSVWNHKIAKKISNFYVANVEKTGWHCRKLGITRLLTNEHFLWQSHMKNIYEWVFFTEENHFFSGQGLLSIIFIREEIKKPWAPRLNSFSLVRLWKFKFFWKMYFLIDLCVHLLSKPLLV